MDSCFAQAAAEDLILHRIFVRKRKNLSRSVARLILGCSMGLKVFGGEKALPRLSWHETSGWTGWETIGLYSRLSGRVLVFTGGQ